MKFTVLTLFPEQVYGALYHSIFRRAVEQGKVELDLVQIRDYAINDYGQVDDSPFGGGRGMVMRCEPIYDAWRSVFDHDDRYDTAKTYFLTPSGKTFDQSIAHEIAELSHVIFLCGHYEGVDARVVEEIGAEELSIGDFVLTGGELAAAVVIDSVTRLIPGVLPDEEAWKLESFSDSLLEWPQYTRPALWRNREVPSVLRSGHAAMIERERRLMSWVETVKKRPDLIDGLAIDDDIRDELILRLAESDRI